MKKVRWGLISASRIAQTFVKDMPYVEQGEIVAVAARNLADATRFADRFDIDKAYGSYQQLLDDPEIDAVYISTPHVFHFEHAKAAILAGKSVLCEKPCTVTEADSIELTTLAKQHNVFLMEGMWTYFLPALQKAKKWVESGRIGNVVQVDADFGYPITYDVNQREYNKNLGASSLLEMGIYPVALAYFFMQCQPESIASIVRFAPNGVDEDVKILCDYKLPSGNVSVSLATSFNARLPNCAYIVGTEGYIVIPDFFRASECMLHVLDDKIEHFTDNRKGSGFEFETQAACEDILAGRIESNIMPHQATINFQRMMDSVKKQF